MNVFHSNPVRFFTINLKYLNLPEILFLSHQLQGNMKQFIDNSQLLEDRESGMTIRELSEKYNKPRTTINHQLHHINPI